MRNIAMEDIPNPIYLNERWRVQSDGIQWILQRRKGEPTDKSTGWKAEKFHRFRDPLIESIEDLCGEIHPNSRDTLNQLPARHP